MKDDELAQVRTKKKDFLNQIERIIPWGEWLSLIKPCYYKGVRGNKPYDLERMLRIYLIQNLYNLSDMATVAEVIGVAFTLFAIRFARTFDAQVSCPSACSIRSIPARIVSMEAE